MTDDHSTLAPGATSLDPTLERLELEIPDSKGTSEPPRCSLDLVVRVPSSSGVVELDYNTIRLQKFSGEEGISQAFSFTLEVRANDYTEGGGYPWQVDDVNGAETYQAPPLGSILDPSVNVVFDFDSLLGCSATTRIGLLETLQQKQSPYPNQRPVTLFNGVITAISMSDRGVYHLSVQPRLSILNFQNGYRVHHGTIKSVILDLLGTNGIGVDSSNLKTSGLSTHRSQDWLQAGETDFAFFERLIKKAGIFYYFEHTDDDHILVLCDDATYLKTPSVNGASDAPARLFLSYSKSSLGAFDRITQFSFNRTLTTQSVSTVIADRQPNWMSQAPAQVSPIYKDDSRKNLAGRNIEMLHMVGYGADSAERELRKQQYDKQLLSARSKLSGSSTLPTMRSGYFFEVADRQPLSESEVNNYSVSSGMVAPIRPELNGTKMVAITVNHSADVGGEYSNQFSAVDAAGFAEPFQAPSDNQSSILAQVVSAPTTTASASDGSASSLQGNYLGSSVETNSGDTSKWLNKGDFTTIQSKSFSYGTSATPYSSRGLYVRFVTQDSGDEPIWVALSSDMTTIPELGAFVTVGRAQNDTEVPEIQQLVEAGGSKNIMPNFYSQNTSWGNSYNTSFGDSCQVSMGGGAQTAYSDGTKLVDSIEAEGLYDDVSFSDRSSSSVSFTKRSASVSVSGELPSGYSPARFSPDPDGKTPSSFAQYSYAYNYGSSYSKNHQVGDAESHSINNGDQINQTENFGSQDNTTTNHGNVTNYACDYGAQMNTTHNHGRQETETQNYGFVKTHTEGRKGGSNVTIESGEMSNTSENNKVYNKNTTNVSADLNITGSSSSINVLEYSNSLNVTKNSNSINVTEVETAVNAVGASMSTNATGVALSLKADGYARNYSVCSVVENINIGGETKEFTLGPGWAKVEVDSFETKVKNVVLEIPGIKVVL